MAYCPSRRWSVKPSAQPTLVRTLDLPSPAAETPSELGQPGHGLIVSRWARCGSRVWFPNSCPSPAQSSPGPDRRDVLGDRLAASGDVLLGPRLLVLLDDLLVEHEEAVLVDERPLPLTRLPTGRCGHHGVAVEPRAVGERSVEASGQQCEVADGLH